MRFVWPLALLSCAISTAFVHVQAGVIEASYLPQPRALGSRCGHTSLPKCGKDLYCPADRHCAPKGIVGAPCKSRKRCENGAVCFNHLCYGDTGRPNKSTCSADSQCASGYCAARTGLCKTPRKIGAQCNRNVQCASGSCDLLATKKCIAASTTSLTATQTSATSTSTSALPTGTGPSTASQASAALASATPVSDSSPYNSNGILQGPGQVRTLGEVKVVSTTLGPAVELAATNQSPSVVEEKLSSVLERRQTSDSKVFSFNYNVVGFASTNATNGQCSAVPSINGNALSPPLTITSATRSGTAFYNYQGSVSSYAITIVCDPDSQTRVQFDSVSVTSASSSTTSSSIITPSTTTTTTTTSISSSVTPTPIPTSPSCVGLTDCGYESGQDTAIHHSGSSNDDGGCGVTSDPQFVHSGTYAEKCTLKNTGSRAYEYINGGADRDEAYVAGKDYTLVFWVKFASGGDPRGLQCTVSDDDTNAYDGICPITTTSPQNGFYQVAIPFTATSQYMEFYIFMTKVAGDYAFDDFSMLDGKVTYDYTTTTAAPTQTYAPPKPTAGAAQNCVGIENCSFETGDTTGYTTVIHGNTNCKVTSEASAVRTGTYAYLCDLYSNADGTTEGGLIEQVPAANMTSGTTYEYSFYAVNPTAARFSCSIGKGGYSYFNGAIPKVGTADSKGYQKYATTFTVYEQDGGAIGLFDCRFTAPGEYYLDDFALTPVG